MSEVRLRDYQREAVAAIRTSWNDGVRRPACVLPTGAGKTVVFADLIMRDLRDGSDRVLVLAHRDELIRQAVQKIKSVAPYLRVGVCKAGEDQVGAPVVVGSVQTLRNESRRRRVRNVGLVVVDECHHATAPSYRDVLGHYGCFDGGARAVGFTATMSRGDGVGLGSVWQEVVYERDIRYMITRGFLVPPRGVHVRVDDLDLSKVRRSGGDYADGALGEALTASLAPERIVDSYREHGANRPALLFVPTVAFAELMVDRFGAAGVSARVVHGGQAADERRAALAAFSDGRCSVLVNCMVLTEGTDLPLASCVMIARPTTHVGLYVQMVGRVLRPYPGKTEALVLDVVGVSRRHVLAGLVDLIGERDEVAKREAEEAGEVDGIEDEGEVGSYVQRAWLDGSLVSEEVDLFHGQRARWQRTHAGHWFVAVGERFLTVIPSPLTGAWDVVSVNRKEIGNSDWVVRGVSDLGYAMAHAESVIGVREHSLAKRRAPWRGKPVSADQARRLQRYGVADVAGLANQGAAADLMNVWDASLRIDPRVPVSR